MTALLEPFSYGYMVNAIWVSGLVGGVCGFLSAFLMLKGWSLIGDALSHAIVPGVAGAYMLGLPFAAGAFLAGLLAAAAILSLQAVTRLKHDAVIGLIFTSFFGLGLFMVSLSPTSVNVQTIVMGNILAVTPADTAQLVIIAGVTLAILLLKWRDLMAVFFDEPYARSIGLPAQGLKVLFFALLAACTVAALLTVGAFLVIAMVVTPGATAYLLTDRFGRLCALASGIGAASGLTGAYASYFLDGATGGIIVVLQTLVFLVALVVAPEARDAGGAPPAARGGALMGPLTPFAFDFMQRAFAVTAIVAVPMALLSCFLVLRGWSLMGDAISHAVLPGIVVAYWFGAPLALGAFAAGMLCAGATGFVKENSRVKEDTAMGIVFSGMFALGVVLYVWTPTDVHLDHILFGDPLGVSWPDVAKSAGIALPVSLAVLARAARAPRARLRPAARAGDRAAGPAAALRPPRARLADGGGGAAGGRDHPGDRLPDRAGRDRLPLGAPLRADAGGRDRRWRPARRSPGSMRASGSTARRRRRSCW